MRYFRALSRNITSPPVEHPIRRVKFSSGSMDSKKIPNGIYNELEVGYSEVSASDAKMPDAGQ